MEETLFDERGRVTLVTQAVDGADKKWAHFAYTDWDQLAGVERRVGVNQNVSVADAAYTYDTANQLTAMGHAAGLHVFASYQLQYDRSARLVALTTPDGTSKYAYDDLNQLTGSANSGAGPDEKYKYSPNGNRTSPGYQTGNGNLLKTDGANLYEYDAEGNRTRQTNLATGEVTLYAWDHRNRLTSVKVTSARGILLRQVDYQYDIFDRQVARSVVAGATVGDVAERRFVFDGQRVALAFDALGRLMQRYLYGPQTDQVLAVDEVGEKQAGQAAPVLWALTDHLGSVRNLIDSTGAVQAHLNVAAWETKQRVRFRPVPLVSAMSASSQGPSPPWPDGCPLCGRPRNCPRRCEKRKVIPVRRSYRASWGSMTRSQPGGRNAAGRASSGARATMRTEPTTPARPCEKAACLLASLYLGREFGGGGPSSGKAPPLTPTPLPRVQARGAVSWIATRSAGAAPHGGELAG